MKTAFIKDNNTQQIWVDWKPYYFYRILQKDLDFFCKMSYFLKTQDWGVAKRKQVYCLFHESYLDTKLDTKLVRWSQGLPLQKGMELL